MKITQDSHVTIDYTLTNDLGEVLDTSEGGAPLSYIQGRGYLIPGLERELEGKENGDQIKVSVKPQDAYGERNETLVQEIPRDRFDPEEQIEVGSQFQVHTDAGNMVVSVVKIDDEKVVVDGNHPLAGMSLNFQVQIKEVRQATSDEIKQLESGCHGGCCGGHDHDHEDEGCSGGEGGCCGKHKH